MVELGRADIGVEVSQLSSFLAYPRNGHMEAALHIMMYIRVKHNSRLVLDPNYANIDLAEFNDKVDWHAFYGDVKEAMPPNAPPPLGYDAEFWIYVGSDYAEDCSWTCFPIFLNMSMIDWVARKRAIVEVAVFEAEFIATYETRSWSSPRDKVQITHDGCTYHWPYLHLWRQLVHYQQYLQAWISPEKEEQ